MADINLPTVGTGAQLFGDGSLPDQVNKQVSDVQLKATAYGDALGSVADGMTQIANQRQQNVEQMGQQHASIAADVQDRTTQLMDRAKPVFARQAAIDARREEVAQMNPFKRALLGLVNPNYSMEHLDKLHDVNQGAIADVGNEYQTMSALSGKLYDLATSSADDKDKVLGAKQGVLENTVSIAANNLAASRAALHDSTEAISADAASLTAQSALQDQVLGTLSAGEINQAIGSAKNGVATVGGAQLSVQQLKNQATRLQTIQLDLASRQLALSNGQIEHANLVEARAIDHMTPQQRLAALQNNGMFQGHQLSVENLARGVNADQANADALSTNSAHAAQAQMTMGLFDSYHAVASQTLARAAQMNGGKVPPMIDQQVRAAANLANQMHLELDQTQDKVAKQRILSSYAPRMQALEGDLDKAVTGAVNGMTRDKDSQTMMKGWLMGQPVDAETTTRGLIGMYGSGAGMPNFIRKNSPDAVAWQAGQAAYGRAMSQVGQMKGSADEKKAFVAQQVSGAVQSAAANAHGYLITGHAIDFAKQINHPAGQIDPHDWRVAQTAGDQSGKKQFADQYGLALQQVDDLFSGGQKAQAVLGRLQTNTNASGKDIQALKTELNAMQNAQALSALDHSASARPGFQPSRALVSLFNDDRFQAAAGQSLDRAASSSFGGFITDGMAGGAIRGNIYNYAQNMQKQLLANDVKQQTDYANRMSMYGGNPVARAGAIIGSIPGMDQHTEAVLMSHVSQIAKSAPPGMNQSDAITQFIHGQGGKFQNPALEKARALAAKHWDEASTRTDAAMQRLQTPVAGVAASM